MRKILIVSEIILGFLFVLPFTHYITRLVVRLGFISSNYPRSYRFPYSDHTFFFHFLSLFFITSGLLLYFRKNGLGKKLSILSLILFVFLLLDIYFESHVGKNLFKIFSL